MTGERQARALHLQVSPPPRWSAAPAPLVRALGFPSCRMSHRHGRACAPCTSAPPDPPSEPPACPAQQLSFASRGAGAAPRGARRTGRVDARFIRSGALASARARAPVNGWRSEGRIGLEWGTPVLPLALSDPEPDPLPGPGPNPNPAPQPLTSDGTTDTDTDPCPLTLTVPPDPDPTPATLTLTPPTLSPLPLPLPWPLPLKIRARHGTRTVETSLACASDYVLE